ncbi:MAG: hypothetical protein QGG53_36665 [Planctomycetota bacterium]|jgi:preprotein translocase subunit SecA|nr:hypothetical protein [Planctomycetota bacterium]
MTFSPTREHRISNVQKPREITKGLDALVDKQLGRFKRRASIFRKLTEKTRGVDKLEDYWMKATFSELRERMLEMKEIFLRSGKRVEDYLPEALAILREISARKLELRPFSVQITGALALRQGYLAEIATGEGKTLVAGLAAVLAGWTGKPCHVITANDYLAERDAQWLKPLYEFCGLSVGHVIGAMDAEARKMNYARDITYTTSKEVCADFLRDSLLLGKFRNPSRRLVRDLVSPNDSRQKRMLDRVVLRGLHTAIIDEADSLLIDEAVTPLIISSPQENAPLESAYNTARNIASNLVADEDFKVELRYKEVQLTEAGKEKIKAQCQRLPGLWRGQLRSEELIKQAISANELFKLDKHYVIQDGQAAIVDEFTGRIMPNRTWSLGLHQAIQAKEDIEITPPQTTLARMSFQRFFRLYPKLSGMTGTAAEAANEFWHIYRLPVVTIPHNRPCARQDKSLHIFLDQDSKWNAIVDEIREVHATERPILVGTRSVADSERLAARLSGEGLKFHLLNAVRHETEADIISRAGERSNITIATNMAGRGTDIQLAEGVAELGGLHVVMCEPHESPRIDRQLYGRAGRQGDPGTAQPYASFDDELVRRFISEKILNQFRNRMLQGVPGASAMLIRLAQSLAHRQTYRQRQSVLRADTWLEESLSFADA